MIAAAPDMLDALRDINNLFRKHLIFDRDRDLWVAETIDAVRAAIAKAEGRD